MSQQRCHSPSETGQSFMQYCPGGLLQWVSYRFKQVNKVLNDLKWHFDATHKECCAYAVSLFSKVEELYKDRVRAFDFKGSL